MNSPGLLALAVSQVSGLPLTLAAHARDAFVDADALPVLMRHARLVRVCNQDVADQLVRGAGQQTVGKIRLIHHGINLQTWKPPRQCLASLRLVAVGRFVEKKGFYVLLRSCRLLHDAQVRFELCLIGDGPLRSQLQETVLRERLAPMVSLTGWLPPSRLRRLLQAANAIILPSIVAEDGDHDGIPNVLLEAAGCGVPAVASSLPGPSEFVRHAHNGLLCQPGDPISLAESIRTVLSDRTLRNRLGANARAIVESEFDERRSLRRIQAFFAEAGGDYAAG